MHEVDKARVRVGGNLSTTAAQEDYSKVNLQSCSILSVY